MYLITLENAICNERYQKALDILLSDQVWSELYTDQRNRLVIISESNRWISYAPQRITQRRPKRNNGISDILRSITDQMWRRLISFLDAADLF